MLWLNFDTWSGGQSKFFAFKRIWRKGYKWTPFIRIWFRKHYYPMKIRFKLGKYAVTNNTSCALSTYKLLWWSRRFEFLNLWERNA